MKTTHPKATTVLLIRHGLTPTTGKILPGRMPGLHLSDEGRTQAESVASRLAGVKLAAVYASQLERARETAAPIARGHGLAVRIERDLADTDYGEWTGIKIWRAARKPEWKAIQGHPSGFRFAGGESFVEMQARVTRAIGALVERHRGGVVVAVSHADPIKAAVAHALGTPLDLFQRIMVAPCSITAVIYWPTGATVLTVNSTDGALASLAKP
ncbi:MAG: MSMEG_4193 family putative phosphomutase [Candidatus Rokuibacteriota bacterium]